MVGQPGLGLTGLACGAEVEVLGDAVLELVGVGCEVDVVEAQDGEEVVDAVDVAVGDLGLDGVADLGAEEVLEACGDLEGALDDGRTDDDVDIDVGAVDWVGRARWAAGRCCRRESRAGAASRRSRERRRMARTCQPSKCEGKGELGAKVEALDDAGGGEVRLDALEAGGGGVEAPEEGRAGDGVVEGVEVEDGAWKILTSCRAWCSVGTTLRPW